MPSLTLRLADIVSDPDNPIDFLRLAPEDAISGLREIYGYLGPDLTVEVTGDTVTLTLPEPHPFAQGEADRQTKRAQRAAEKGNYAAAIGAYEEVLRVLPAQSQVRRDLAMAHMETDNAAAARTEVVRALRLNPEDPWAYLLLGNIALRFGDDRTRALSYFRRAYRLAPDDLYILNSYGALCGREGDLAEAETLFERALTLDPGFPNARHGLALVYDRQGRSQDAEAQLRELFSRPRSSDIRAEPVYAQGSDLYLKIQHDLAQANFTLFMDRLRGESEDLGRATGYPIRWQEMPKLEVAARAELAWMHGRSEHIVRYRTTDEAILPHRIAHELEHIRLIYEARTTDRNRLFASTPATLEHARRLVGQDRRKLRAQGLPETAIDQYLEMVTRGLTSQVFNNPLDMVIETRVRQRYDYLYPSQFVSLHDTQGEALQALVDRSIREQAPQVIWEANVTMNVAFALFTDGLFAGFTDYAAPYRTERQFNQGRKLFQLWQKRAPTLRSGDEYDLVDAFASILGLRDWFVWQPDRSEEPRLDADVWQGIDVEAAEAQGREAEAGLLHQKESAAVMYLLGTLERYDRLNASEVNRITAEIALLGRTGLDYTSSDRKYTLDSIPGEQFTGLQLMCMLYVGLKRTASDLDPGMPFADAYRTALSLHGSPKD